MICETCRWSGRPGFVPVGHSSRTVEQAGVQPYMVPCPDCGGQGVGHCCDGICAQPEVTLSRDVAS